MFLTYSKISLVVNSSSQPTVGFLLLLFSTISILLATLMSSELDMITTFSTLIGKRIDISDLKFLISSIMYIKPLTMSSLSILKRNSKLIQFSPLLSLLLLKLNLSMNQQMKLGLYSPMEMLEEPSRITVTDLEPQSFYSKIRNLMVLTYRNLTLLKEHFSHSL